MLKKPFIQTPGNFLWVGRRLQTSFASKYLSKQTRRTQIKKVIQNPHAHSAFPKLSFFPFRPTGTQDTLYLAAFASMERFLFDSIEVHEATFLNFNL